MKTLFTLFMVLLGLNTQASIVCHTPRMNKIFEVSNQKVTFFSEFDVQSRREVASISSRARPEIKGITKIVDFENHKHTIHIADVDNFSDVDDYMIIKSSNGHEVTYPITCENK